MAAGADPDGADAGGDAGDGEDVRVEVVVVDYYMSAPLPSGALKKLVCSPCYLLAQRVPVVRVFGATHAGQKALVHIHGIFPYFYFRAEDDPAFEDANALHQLLPLIAQDIERANAAKQAERGANAGRNTRVKVIAKLLIVQGRPFYGYHPAPKLFVQIFLYHPATMASVVQLLESGAIAQRRFQPYEAHVPFLLQVFADYNIEGMNHLHLSHIKFRSPLPRLQTHLSEFSLNESPELRVFLASNTPPDKIHNPREMESFDDGRYAPVGDKLSRWCARQSSCALEIDVAADAILNRKLASDTQSAQEEAGEARQVPSLAVLWEEERLRRIMDGEQATPGFSLSVSRNPIPNEGSTPSALSSVSCLSQSDFHRKMRKAVDSVLEQLLSQTKDTGEPNEEERSSNQLGDLPEAGLTQSESGIQSSSKYSFSQMESPVNAEYTPAEHQEGNDEDASSQSLPGDAAAVTNATDREEDTEIMQLLLAMQRSAAHQTKEHTNAVASEAVFSDQESVSSDEDRPHDEDFEAEADSIMASQQLAFLTDLPSPSQKDNTTSGSWWEVGETSSVSSSSPMKDLGSSRLLATPDQSPARERRHIQTPGTAEDIADVCDADDVLPPRPPVRLSIDSAEDSYPCDLVMLSMTPQPRVMQHQRIDSESSNGRNLWVFQPPPPLYENMVKSSSELGVKEVVSVDAFYSAREDIPEKAMVFGGRKFDFVPRDLQHLSPFDTSTARLLWNSTSERTRTTMRQLKQPARSTPTGKVRRVRIPARIPPMRSEVEKWLKMPRRGSSSIEITKRRKEDKRDQPSTTSSASSAASFTTPSNLTLLSLEIHANCRGYLLPNPILDPVSLICYEVEAQEGPQEEPLRHKGLIIVDEVVNPDSKDAVPSFCIGSGQVEMKQVPGERALFIELQALVQHWDPDFLVGFEVQKNSIGYLVDRAAQLDINLIQTLSRLPFMSIDLRNPLAPQPQPEIAASQDDSVEASIGTTWGVTKASGLWIHGRYVLNLWRLTRSELKLPRYAREDVIRAVLKREWPVYSHTELTAWYTMPGPHRWRVVRYVLQLASLNLRVLAKMQLITRTSQMARLFGIDFYSVLSRGSQYRVEAVMLRVTKRQNYVLVSPSRNQVAGQPPMECIPLVMEPHSCFYPDPVVVLDFQSLYPSLVIGYNLCYSTYLGRLKGGLHAELETIMGCVDYTPCAEALLASNKDIIVSPNGALFCPKRVRLGVLPVILDEILSTRIMVKNALKKAKAQGRESLERVLNARQLALKMIANVTYGYTAAGFSGRMPCAQLADAIVQSGRSTLEAAVKLVESHSEWNARVVYGDTDSLFVLLPGRSKEQAFRIGQEIADAVTRANPKPVTLKMEKVYMGSILVSKKRYVGFKYEHPDQATGVIDAKGIETIRRDSCGVVQKAMHRALTTLFASSDLSAVKRQLEAYWIQMLNDQLPVKDFIFAKEVRLGTYGSSAPPAALVSTKAMSRDPRAEPRYAERVPYVVVNGAPGSRLMDLVVSPEELVSPRSHRTINYQYYIHKQIIPSLERLFLLMGANIRAWYAALPRSAVRARAELHEERHRGNARSIDSFYRSTHCQLCGGLGRQVLCDDCLAHAQRTNLALEVATAQRERELHLLRLSCHACTKGDAIAANGCANVTCHIWNEIFKALK